MSGLPLELCPSIATVLNSPPSNPPCLQILWEACHFITCTPKFLYVRPAAASAAAAVSVGEVLAPLVSGLPLELRPSIEAFLANCLAVFDDLDATLLEMNPFTLDPSGKPFPLDIRMVRQALTFYVSYITSSPFMPLLRDKSLSPQAPQNTV